MTYVASESDSVTCDAHTTWLWKHKLNIIEVDVLLYIFTKSLDHHIGSRFQTKKSVHQISICCYSIRFPPFHIGDESIPNRCPIDDQYIGRSRPSTRYMPRRGPRLTQWYCVQWQCDLCIASGNIISEWDERVDITTADSHWFSWCNLIFFATHSLITDGHTEPIIEHIWRNNECTMRCPTWCPNGPSI